VKKRLDHQERIHLYSHECADPGKGNQISKVYPHKMRDQDEESNCHVYENKGVVQLAVVPDELVGVPAFALLDHAVFWGVVHEGLGA